MERTKEIEILIEDGCTKAEAERFMSNGSMVFNESDAQDFLNILNMCYDEPRTLEDVEANRVTDVGFVVFDSEKYYIIYVN